MDGYFFDIEWRPRHRQNCRRITYNKSCECYEVEAKRQTSQGLPCAIDFKLQVKFAITNAAAKPREPPTLQ
jgi:hypothetical protein